MSCVIVLILAILNVVILAIPLNSEDLNIPQNLDDLNIDTDDLAAALTFDLDDLVSKNNPNNAEHVDCTSETSSDTPFGDEIANINHPANIIQRRKGKFCPQTGFRQTPSKPYQSDTPQIVEKQPTDPSQRTSSGNSRKPCDAARPILVSCGGPEIVDEKSYEIKSVANCVIGDAAVIPARIPWDPVFGPLIAKYCCEDYDGREPDYASDICTKLTPEIETLIFTHHDEFEIYKEHFLPGHL